MLDPFPFEAPALLQQSIKPIVDYFSLQTLPLHIHELLAAALFYHFTNTVISPAVSTRLFPSIYPQLNRRTRLNWDVHVVSLVQSTLINVIALWISYADDERADMNWKGRVWGYTGAGGLVQAFACGYFLWDLWISLRHVKVFGFGLLAHAVSALVVYSFGFRPFINFYGPTFILYELSSPFLNVHWFCDKLNLTGSKIQLYNGFLLLGTFFGARICWGTYQSVRVFSDIFRAISVGGVIGDKVMGMGEGASVNVTMAAAVQPTSEMMRFAGDQTVPVWLAGTYLASNLTLNTLNIYWFNKMVETVRKRFEPPFGTKKPEKAAKKEGKEKVLVEGIDVNTVMEADVTNLAANGDATLKVGGETMIARGLYDDGRKTVEVEKTEVRNRRRGRD